METLVSQPVSIVVAHEQIAKIPVISVYRPAPENPVALFRALAIAWMITLVTVLGGWVLISTWINS